MSDQNVKAAQKYLNAMFGGHKDWVKLDEDGKTGTAVMQGIIRAFQIQNGISTITGTVGPLTINTMKKLAIITKMDPNDTPQVNVCLIQCALFCKGYAAGGITGIYYTSGVNAVKKMQENAGLEVTGKIDWKVWSGLLSLNWFTKVSGGDSNIVLIQQQLNSDWSDVIGVGPCDGIASRQTILSLVGALQAAEGVTTELITDLNSVNFGDATTNAFPGTLQNGQNSTKYVPFNKIAQYGLYFNGYNPGRFDGVFDSTTESKVSEFQEFYGLTGIGLVTKGKVNVSTMKSLLTSKGDTNRAAKACDCATVLNKQQALDIKNAGYTHVGRYLTGSVGKEHTPKYLTSTEVKNIENAGLSVFPIYQDGGYELNYFKDPSQGNNSSEATTPVWVEDVQLRNIEEYITTTGTAKAAKTIEIKSETNGAYYLQKNPKTGRPYQLGDIVEAGAVIIRLENKEYENNVQLESKKLQIQITEKEWEGQKILLEKGGATEKDVNNAENSYINAKLALENGYITLEKLSIKAPFKGVIVNLPYYTPGVEVASGSVMVGLMDYSKMYVETQFPENTLTKLRIGQQVHITNYNIKSDTLRGILTQLSPAINEETRTFSGYIEIDNPDLKLRPGMFAKADIVTVRKDSVISIPKDIIKNRRGGKLVYTVDRNSAEEKVIHTGISDDKYIEVEKGLEAGDKIVVKGYEWLRNRSKVKVMK